MATFELKISNKWERAGLLWISNYLFLFRIHKCLKHFDAYSCSGEIWLRRGVLGILLLPIVIFIFVIGWSLSWIGEQQNRRVVANRAETATAKEGKAEECVEVGLIENLMEKMLEAE